MSTAADLDQLIEGLDVDLDAAPGRLRLRPEWKRAEACLSELRADREGLIESPEQLEDRVREGNAVRDILALAADEESQSDAAEGEFKRNRLRDDETLLGRIEGELKVYTGLIVTAFLLPLFLVAPFGNWCLLGAVPAVTGSLRMHGVMKESEGRTWLILQDRVDQVVKKVKFAHILSGSAALLSLLWFVFAFLRTSVAGG